jgi:hypothetical protein
MARCVGQSTTVRMIRCTNDYCLQYFHIQAALKLTRRSGNNQAHLEKLMKPYTSHENRGNRILNRMYHIHPKIINSKFLLFKQIRWRKRFALDPASAETIEDFTVCNHLIWRPQDRHHERNPFVQKITSALGYPWAKQSGLCDICPTEYSVEFKDEDLTVSAWKDIGSSGTSLDANWQALHSPAWLSLFW